MYDRQTWSRLARLKARKIYREMQVEGLNQNDLSRKLREVAEREEAAVRRFVYEYGVDAIDARL
jgi:cytidylate kinase